MKTTNLLMALVAMVLSYTSFGQSISIGVRAGANFSTLEEKDDVPIEVNRQYAAGINAGLVVNYEINDLFSIQPELLYSQKGTRAGSLSFQDETIPAATAKHNYLEVPVLAKVSFGSDIVQGFVTGGPTVGYFMNGSYRNRESGEKQSLEVDGRFKRFDAGASFGIGTSYAVGAGAINLDLRYSFGLTNLYKFSNQRTRNQTFGLSVAYLFEVR